MASLSDTMGNTPSILLEDPLTSVLDTVIAGLWMKTTSRILANHVLIHAATKLYSFSLCTAITTGFSSSWRCFNHGDATMEMEMEMLPWRCYHATMEMLQPWRFAAVLQNTACMTLGQRI
jgi:hypothetical protein